MKIEPFGDQILVNPIEKKSPFVSEQKLFCEYGTVVAVGQDVKSVKPGDTIGFTVWGLNHLEIDGKKHYFVQEDPRFILGKISLPEQLAS